MTILEKLRLADIKAVQVPIAEAKGLPNVAYTDKDVFVFERDNVIGKTWAGLDFSSSLPEPGYAKPLDFMGLPLVLIRDKNNELRVFHNVCSHRGMVLIHEEGPVKNLIRCRYHSWSYDQQGELKSTPHIGGVGNASVDGFSCVGKGLKEVRSGQWMGVIFINLSGVAESFDEYIKPLNQRWEALTGKGEIAKLKPAASSSRMNIDIKSNWKFAIENYCEAYHLPWVHPELNSYSPLEVHENLHINDYMTGQITHNYTLSEVSGHTLPAFEQWPEEKRAYGEYVSLYPNMLLGLQVDHAFAIILEPQAHDKTLEKLELSYVSEAARGEQMGGCRQAVMAAWKTVFEEDIFAVEGMQQGRQSSSFNGGFFSPIMDAPSYEFHLWVAKKYQAALTEEDQ
jgi:choline monooxygenase